LRFHKNLLCQSSSKEYQRKVSLEGDTGKRVSLEGDTGNASRRPGDTANESDSRRLGRGWFAWNPNPKENAGESIAHFVGSI
jgi:hypothetical protein